ncbi:MAG TPA: CbiX/SirB N-terminal domain-containing protein [Pyrinomonadaceae bacterium]|nr:CbiX/SirB N-terminal domain-containing protein [Pyrinomonadaceae bacterium]
MRTRLFTRSLKAAALSGLFAIATMPIFAQHDHSAHTMPTARNKTGVLLLAHGGKAAWNDEVNGVAAEVRKQFPVEIAFGMATKRNIQNAIDKLEAQGVTSIVAVPLFISSNSSVITSTEYLLGLRNDAPADLAVFAKMDHGGGHGGTDHSAQTSMSSEPFDPTTPVKHKVPITMRKALDADPTVADILLSRASSISKDAPNEIVIVVAHGPVSAETNRLWLKDMATLADGMKAKSSYRGIEYLTVRDDAPEPIRGEATAEFRSLVEKANAQKVRVLIVPLLLSFGGIEDGVNQRLNGLDYTITSQALLPDTRIAQWVVRSVNSSSSIK